MADRSEAEVLVAARDWKAAGHQVALATVVKTWGSSPRPAGSHLVVRDDSFFLGSVSGGCVEGAVVQEALGVMQTGVPKVLEFGITHEQAWEVGLACGGKVHIFVEPLQ
jgi:xanthine/CO dehydrogenase XdhC/CoxF family maturation factor